MKRPYQSFSLEKLIKRQSEFLEQIMVVTNKDDIKFVVKNMREIRNEFLYRIALHAD